jgi:mono/diheme cytochrome c family protein
MWRTNLKVLALTVIVIGFYTMVARIIPQLESEVPEVLDLSSDASPEALAAAGEQVYNGAGGCTACHGLGSRAPNLLTDHAGEGAIGARCGSRQAGADCKAYLWESLTDPGAYIVDGFDNIMPDMRRQLPEDQVWAVMAFLQSYGGEITVTAADLPAAGGAGAAPTTAAPAGGAAFSATMDPRALIQEQGCIACHLLDGQGGPIGPAFDGMGGRIDAARIRRGIVDPAAEVAAGYEAFAGTMPPIFGQQLSAGQLEALVQFLAERR